MENATIYFDVAVVGGGPAGVSAAIALALAGAKTALIARRAPYADNRTTALLGEDVKARYADLKQASADRCPRLPGTFVKAPEVQYHHEVYNQYLWNMF